MTTSFGPRVDSWGHREDVLLAEIVLRHIRNGSTQLRGFEEASKQLGRTPGACGFRWNSIVRKRYLIEIEEAKIEREKLKEQNRKQKSENSAQQNENSVQYFEDSIESEVNTVQNENTQKLTLKQAKQLMYTLEGEIDWLKVVLYKEVQESRGVYLEDIPEDIETLLKQKLEEKENKLNQLQDAVRRVEETTKLIVITTK